MNRATLRLYVSLLSDTKAKIDLPPTTINENLEVPSFGMLLRKHAGPDPSDQYSRLGPNISGVSPCGWWLGVLLLLLLWWIN